jgi:hypothetical protein
MVSRRKEFSHWLEVERDDGSVVRYRVYSKGNNVWIVNECGYEHLVHPSARSIEDEVRIVFHTRVLRSILPGME